MSDITLRSVKGTPLTNTEVDDNFSNLNTDKYESGDSPTFVDIVADSIQLTGGTGDQGTISWNIDEETIDVIIDGTVLQVGQEVVLNIRNNSGSLIPDGTPVMTTGTIGASGRITVSPMDGTSIANSKRFIGVTTEDIANDADGKVTFFGKVRGINLSSYNDGDILWISPTTPGAYTNVEPSSGIKIAFAFVVSNAINGTLFVRASNGHALHESHDVSVPSPSLNDVLAYDGSKWVNVSSLTLSALTVGGTAFTDKIELTDLSVTTGSPSGGGSLSYSDITGVFTFIPAAAGSGTVTSVAATVPTGFAISGSPITTSGTLAVTFDTGYSLPTDASQTNWDTAYGWGDHSTAGYLTSETYTGTVTSVAATVPTGFTVTGSPVTTTGTLALAFDTGYSLPTDASQANWNTAFGWGDHASAGYLTSETFTGTVTSVSITTPTGLVVTGSPITTTGTLALAFDTGYSIPTDASQANWNTAFGWGDHAGLYSLTSHNHSGVYEPADATILKDADIGITVQAYDATLLNDADIGVSVQGYSAVLAGTTASFTSADETKLDGIEALADVTDTLNVTAAGALMSSEVDANLKTLSLPASVTITSFASTVLDDVDASAFRSTLGLGTAAITASTDYATAAQGALAASALQPSAIGVSVQAYDATYLVDADIGTTVQAYDATYLVDADIGVSVQAYDATLLNDADINVTVQAYDATILNNADIGVTVQAYDATYLVDADIGVSVQAFDATYVVDADIGSTVQAQLVSGTNIKTINSTSLLGSGDIVITGGSGTVTSVAGTGTVNGITLTGTVTTSGSLTLGGTLANVDLTSQITGTLPVANGGTGITSFGTGVATALGTAVTGSGGAVLATDASLSGATLNDGYTEEVFAVTGTTPALSPTNGSIQTWTLTAASTPTVGTWAAGQSITMMIDDGTAYTIDWATVAVTWKTDGGVAPTLNTTGYTTIELWMVGSTVYGARVGDA
jgi:hypothetical protein